MICGRPTAAKHLANPLCHNLRAGSKDIIIHEQNGNMEYGTVPTSVKILNPVVVTKTH